MRIKRKIWSGARSVGEGMRTKRKIRTTDIVYSAAARDGSIRFALEPLPDCLPFQSRSATQDKHGDLPFRAVIAPGGERGYFYASCRSIGCVAASDGRGVFDSGPWIGERGQRHWNNDWTDAWLDWLAGDDTDTDFEG